VPAIMVSIAAVTIILRRIRFSLVLGGQSLTEHRGRTSTFAPSDTAFSAAQKIGSADDR
jgi:hypothetical protein